MKYIIDAFAWIEYLEGSSKGEKVSEILNSNHEILVLPITIAEVVSKIQRKNSKPEIAYQSIISKSKIIEMTPRVAKQSGLLHAKMRKKYKQFGIVDSCLIETAKEIKAKILTGDHHFEEFTEAVILN
jgi:predicted nucleic acid-binding protein